MECCVPRTSLTPFLTARAALVSLIVFCLVYALIFVFGALYIHHLLRIGPVGRLAEPPAHAIPNRPLSVVDEPVDDAQLWENSHGLVLGLRPGAEHPALRSARRL